MTSSNWTFSLPTNRAEGPIDSILYSLSVSPLSEDSISEIVLKWRGTCAERFSRPFSVSNRNLDAEYGTEPEVDVNPLTKRAESSIGSITGFSRVIPKIGVSTPLDGADCVQGASTHCLRNSVGFVDEIALWSRTRCQPLFEACGKLDRLYNAISSVISKFAVSTPYGGCGDYLESLSSNLHPLFTHQRMAYHSIRRGRAFRPISPGPGAICTNVCSAPPGEGVKQPSSPHHQ